MKRILIVEDEAQVLVLAESLLKEAEYETLSAGTAIEALAFTNSKERIDLLFTDLGLADQAEGGLVVAQEMAKARPGLPVLYTSGRGVTDGMLALFVHPNGFLPKPYTKDQLLTAIANLIGSAEG
jgi:DNA-binding NtrC family response regulator